ncbi:MAG: hypothetical protein Q8O72_03515 [Bacteroidales bacterium]|nr:hypothetical protein [Bacteroidales bacterium]
METLIHLSEEEIAQCAEAMAGGTLSQLDDRLRKHLDFCPQCAGEVMMVAELTKETGEIAFPMHKSIKPWHYVALLAAASAIILLVINIPGIFNNENPSENKLALSSTDSISVENGGKSVLPEKTDMAIPLLSYNSHSQEINQKNEVDLEISDEILATYAPNETLEKLVENTRVSSRGDDIDVITESGIRFPEADSIEWKNPDSIMLTIEWYNNLGELIKTNQSTGNSIPVPNLENGLYYWKLMNNDFDLLGAGKVVVEK